MVVTASPERCFAVVADIERYPDWAADIKDVTVHERDDLVTAATTMTSSRARCVAVVNDAHEVVGLLDDMALLASFARARRG